MRWGLRIFVWLLRLYPQEFRERFAGEMRQTLSDELRGNTRRTRSFRAWVSAAMGVLVNAPEEHLRMIEQDVKYAWRAMRREKLPTAAAIAVMALGIGSSTAVFTLVNGVLLRPLPFPQQERLVYVEEVGHRMARGAVAYPNYLDLRARNHSLADLALYTDGRMTVQFEGRAERIPAGSATASIFQVLGVQPILGRGFTEEEDRPKGPLVVVLGEDIWRRRFGADPGVIGRTVKMQQSEARIVGVMPRNFHFPGTAEIWVPLQLDPANNTRTDHWLEGIGRLKPDITAAQAGEEFRALMAQILRENPAVSYGQTVSVVGFADHMYARLRPVLLTLLGAVGFLMLIACANMMSLLLVKAPVRVREMALRSALGAPRARLVRGFVVESLMLGLCGAIGGAVLAWITVPALASLAPEGSLPRWIAFTPDWRVAAFVTLMTVGSALIAGLIPAIPASRHNVVEALKEGGRTVSGGVGASWLRNALVVGEIAASMMLLAGAGVMVRSLAKLENRNTGFQLEHVTTMQVVPSQREEKSAAAVRTERILEEFRAAPGVVAAAGTSHVPLLDGWGRSFTAEGRPVATLQDAPMVQHTVVTPGYFRTMGIPLRMGRDFTGQDGEGLLVAIIDEELAKRYWPGESAIGKRVRFGPPENNEPWHTVIGVAGVAYNNSLRELSRNGVYLPYAEFKMRGLSFIVRTAGTNPESALRERLRTIDPTLAVDRVVTMRQVVDRVLWQERFFASIAAGFGALALVMAVVGLYGVMAYSVTSRGHELGIRIALGATAGGIRSMVLRQSGRLVAMGISIGAAAVLAMVEFTPVLEAQVYGVARYDPVTIGAVAVLLAVTALGASLAPAVRATRVDAVGVLRGRG